MIDHDRIPPDAKELRLRTEIAAAERRGRQRAIEFLEREREQRLVARWPMLRRSGWWAARHR